MRHLGYLILGACLVVFGGSVLLALALILDTLFRWVVLPLYHHWEITTLVVAVLVVSYGIGAVFAEQLGVADEIRAWRDIFRKVWWWY